MTANVKKVLHEALALPPEDRRRVAEALLVSLPEDDSPEEVAEAWRVEVLRRIEEVESGAVVTVPLEEVRRNIRAALGRDE